MHISEEIYRYIYIAAMCIFGVSLLLAALYHGVAPFDLRAAWTDQGPGSALVLTRTLSASVESSGQIAASLEAGGQVTLFTVEEVVRHDGELLYRTSDLAMQRYVHARDVTGSVVATVPFVGTLVRALEHPVGMAAVFGIPILMLIINFLAMISRRFASSYDSFVYQTEPEESVSTEPVDASELPRVSQDEHEPVHEDILPVRKSRVASAPQAAHRSVSVDGVISPRMGARVQEKQSRTYRHQSANIVRGIEGILIPGQRYSM